MTLQEKRDAIAKRFWDNRRGGWYGLGYSHGFGHGIMQEERDVKTLHQAWRIIVMWQEKLLRQGAMI